MLTDRKTHFSHWGAFEVETREGELVAVYPHAHDPNPTPLIENFLDSVHHQARVRKPSFREGWLREGATASRQRGKDRFIELDWPEALDILSRELSRVYRDYGPTSVFGGSYGWSSAGRFHHAQSQLHRFLNCQGGYVRSVGSYSIGATEAILPHIIGLEGFEYGARHATSWKCLVENTELMVAFGGLPAKNSAVHPGGVLRHEVPDHLDALRGNGCQFVYLSAIKDDIPNYLNAQWLPIRPGTDTAVMLALAYVLTTENLADEQFLSRYCVGWEQFRPYLLGHVDRTPKDPRWAESISHVPADVITALARKMAQMRTMITTSWSLQRAENGEQPVWMSIVLAAMLGQIGLPGGGFGHGYGSVAGCGSTFLARMPVMPQRSNPVDVFIPSARIADLLLRPGESFDFNGRVLTYPKIRLVYWCGGNPFHHHQDLFRLRHAFTKPETIIVHEPFWTGMAKHADIVLPCTMTLERNDIGAGQNSHHVVAMPKILPAYAEARSDYEIFGGLAERLEISDTFCEGRDEMQWLEVIYEKWRSSLPNSISALPPFAEFWKQGIAELRCDTHPVQILFEEFRADPAANRLKTPTGKIELFSETIKRFNYIEVPGHPVWCEPTEWLGGPRAQSYPIQLIANNPASRLHSQLDVGRHSQGAKIRDREPLRMHPQDASARGIVDGDVARVYNDRGSCLAGVIVSDQLMPGVAQLSTGAWFDPQTISGIGEVCVQGNPNVLTADKGTSRIGQACTGQLVLVEIEKFVGALPAVHAWSPPPLVKGPPGSGAG